MGKLNEDKGLTGRRIVRPLLAISLAASLAAFGCTTNQNLGNGTPTRSGPDVRTAPTSGITSGGETTTPPAPPPMTSSYTKSEALPAVTVRTAARGTSGVIRRSPDEAAAIMAGRQALRGQYLGVVSPGLSNQQYVSANLQTGAFQNPSLQANPQVTINSSISSPPVPAISSGAGEGTIDAGGILTTSGTTAAATFTGTDTTATAASAATLPTGTFAGTGTLPTVASSGLPTVTAASVGAGRTTVAGTTTTGTTTTGTTTTGTTAAATATGTTAIASRTGALRVLRTSTGSVTVTNVGSSTTSGTTTTGTGRNQ
jgi:hypothetical protein